MSAPVAILDKGCGVDPALLRAIAEAVSIAAARDLGRASPDGWGAPAVVRLAASAADVQPGEWVLELDPQPDQPDALGDHTRTATGMPLGRAFPLLEDSPDDLGVTISHEIFEMLADPEIDAVTLCDDGTEYATEVADAVESTWYPVPVASGASVRVSNFVTPRWFVGGAGPYDFLGRCTSPFEVLAGGYVSRRLPDGTWTQVTNGRKRGYRARLDALGLGRLARRAATPSRRSGR